MIGKKIFILSRPRFWLYILGPYLIGVTAGGSIQNLFDFRLWYGLFYFMIPANLFIYTVNDYFDRSIDPVNPKKRKQESFMSIEDQRLYLIIIIVSLLLALPLLTISFLTSAILLCFLFFGFFYSSPPFRFKTKPYLDSLSNFFYILPGVMGYAIVSSSLPPLPILLAGSLWTIAMHLFSAIVDIAADKKAGIRTAATVLGYRKSLLTTGLLWFLSVWLSVPLSGYLIIGLIYTAIPIAILWKKYSIERVYWFFPWINTVIGTILFAIAVFYG